MQKIPDPDARRTLSIHDPKRYWRSHISGVSVALGAASLILCSALIQSSAEANEVLMSRVPGVTATSDRAPSLPMSSVPAPSTTSDAAPASLLQSEPHGGLDSAAIALPDTHHASDGIPIDLGVDLPISPPLPLDAAPALPSVPPMVNRPVESVQDHGRQPMTPVPSSSEPVPQKKGMLEALAPGLPPVMPQPAAAPQAPPAEARSTPPFNQSRAVAIAPMSRTPDPPSWNADHDAAIALARTGKLNEALLRLHKLARLHPEDISIARDYVVVLQWADRHRRAVYAFDHLPKGDEPDYVLEAVGHAYRDLHQPKQALRIYRRGLHQSPKNETFKAGEIRCLSELHQYADGQTIGTLDLQRHPGRLEVLLATGEAADRAGDSYAALGFYEDGLKLAPDNGEAIRAFVALADRMGAAPLAEPIAKKWRAVVGDAALRHVEGDAAANLVRWGPVEPLSEDTRFEATDRAIARLDELIEAWSKEGPAAEPDIIRARFDRMVAYRDRSRMRDVVEEYNRLSGTGTECPNYVLHAVADALLYLHEPEVARDMYLHILVSDPRNFEVRRQLFFAYVECDDFDRAYETIDVLHDEQPKWIWLKGQTEPLSNPDRATTDLDVGNARLFGNEAAEAYRRISLVEETAPNEPRNRAALGEIQASRGWPRAAQDQFVIGLNLQQVGDVENQTGVASTDLDLQNFRKADSETAALLTRYPENLDVQRLDRAWNAHNMAELDVDAGYTSRPSNSQQGGAGYGLETRVYSKPIDYDWRVFAGEYFAHEEEPQDEGSVSFSRSTAGLEYRHQNITADVAPTYNHYHSDERLGVAGNLTIDLNDAWKVGGAGESFSRDTPLRALNAGTTADLVSLNAEWRQSESRSLMLHGEYMPFSDNNQRTGVTSTYTERLFASPHYTIDGLINAGESTDSKDENRPYYNPSQDGAGSFSLLITQPLYRRDDVAYEHSVKLTPGFYWEQAYGVRDAESFSYEQHLHYNETLEAFAAFTFSRQAYDGQLQNDLGVTLNLVKRF